MKNTIFLILSLIILLFFIVVAIYYIFNVIHLIFSTSKKAPYIPSFDRQLKLMKELNLESWTTMVDLGCWDGKALRFFSKEYGLKELDWFDINLYAVLKWRRINKRQKIHNIKLYKKNLFKVDLKKYDYIYVYLWSTQLEIMEDWIWENKKDTATIISNTFEFKKHKPITKIKNKKGIDTIFLYE